LTSGAVTVLRATASPAGRQADFEKRSGRLDSGPMKWLPCVQGLRRAVSNVDSVSVGRPARLVGVESAGIAPARNVRRRLVQRAGGGVGNRPPDRAAQDHHARLEALDVVALAQCGAGQLFDHHWVLVELAEQFAIRGINDGSSVGDVQHHEPLPRQPLLQCPLPARGVAGDRSSESIGIRSARYGSVSVTPSTAARTSSADGLGRNRAISSTRDPRGLLAVYRTKRPSGSSYRLGPTANRPGSPSGRGGLGRRSGTPPTRTVP